MLKCARSGGSGGKSYSPPVRVNTLLMLAEWSAGQGWEKCTITREKAPESIVTDLPGAG